MKSTHTVPSGRAASPPSQAALGLAMALLVITLAPAALSAQGRTMLGLRGGGGVGTGGEAVYVGQVELTDMAAGGSVELAVAGWSDITAGWDRQRRDHSFVYDYEDEMHVRGFGLLASLLWQPLRRLTGPYLAAGLGVGPLWVDWRSDSTDPLFGAPAPGGGTFRSEEGVVMGSLLSVGLGHRLHRRLDVRAQMLSVLVPSTKSRETAKLVPIFTLTTGIGL